MRALVWSLRIAVFLVLFAFAVRNTEVTLVRFPLGFEAQTPLIVIMLLAFGFGIFAGVLAMVGPLFRSRRQISRLRKARVADHPPHVVQPPADG
jgi:putative membrane protein